MGNRIRKIVVVGGGSSGWLSATFLQRMLCRHDPHRVEISLIEAPDIGVLGVGEATIPTLRTTLDFLGIDEIDFMRQTHATFKQAIRFVNWLQPPSTIPDNYYYHPFDRPPMLDGMPAHLALASKLRNCPPHRFAYEVSVQPTLCDAYRSPKLFNDPAYLAPVSYAYHMDAVLMGRYLKKIAIERGIRHIEDKVLKVSRNADGGIAALHTEAGRALEADLYIDCSGFSSLLLKGVFDDPFISYKDSLLCDRAVAIQVGTDPSEELSPYTKSTAMSAGWIWDIQLQDRRGIGYVYSTDFISDENAERELRAYVGAKAEGVDCRHLPMRVGRNQNFWIKNCVAIGLSCGFIEPLESTGIFLVEVGARLLADNLTLDGIQESCIANYNKCMSAYFEQIRDFIVLHYCLTEREDTEFWKANKFNKALPDSLVSNLELWKHRYPSPYDDSLVGGFFNHENYLYILGGMGKLPKLDSCYSGYIGEDRAHQMLMSFSKGRELALRSAPSHHDFISRKMSGA